MNQDPSQIHEKEVPKEEQEDLLLKKVKKLNADITIRQLLTTSLKHREALLNALSNIKIAPDTTLENLINLLTEEKLPTTITFSGKELPPEGPNHNKVLYLPMMSP